MILFFFDTYDYFPNDEPIEFARGRKGNRAKEFLKDKGIFCHPHFGDGNVLDLPGFVKVVLDRIKVPEFITADGSGCEDVAIVYYQSCSSTSR